jgi:hypothetical protein
MVRSTLKQGLLYSVIASAALFPGMGGADAQNTCTTGGCWDYSLRNKAGGSEPVTSRVDGEYTKRFEACGIVFFVNRRTETRFRQHFLPGAQLVRRKDNRTLCRWGNMR